MAFSFNFTIQAETGELPGEEQTFEKENGHSTRTEEHGSAPKQPKEAKEHGAPRDPAALLANAVPETLSIGALPPLRHLNEFVFEQTAPEREDDEAILSQTIGQHSDLISGVYEGGLKVWECTYDLLDYLEQEGETFSGKRVLDLGCGAGLLGLLALKRGASRVHFQDYNSTVIEQLTVPNVLLNCDYDDDDDDDSDEEKDGKHGSPPSKKRALDLAPPPDMARCRFFSGDWTSFLPLLLSEKPPPKYDMILTSETIYNTSYYKALHDVFEQLLANNGVVYLSTKSHYFGVGGGLHLFETFVVQRNVLEVKRLKDIETGLQRHVVSLRFKKS
ncbi:histidine protein methyltransferase 1 homolog [Denticeps clupeoides]|nr:histidine protein methyltransferase 1 homolog [Denticeps clupeoides]